MTDCAFSDTVPSEPGIYLFYGYTWNVQSARDLMVYPPHCEVIRIAKDSRQLLVFLGRDIYYDTDVLVGRWYKVPDLIGEDTMLEIEKRVVQDADLRILSRALAGKRTGLTLEDIVHEITSFARPDSEDAIATKQMVGRAIAAGWFTLALLPAGKPPIYVWNPPDTQRKPE
jgi:hypothetical protein